MALELTFHRPRRVVREVFVHCSASDNPAHDNLETIRRWHVTGNGWSDIGYHYVITSDGSVHEGRPVGRVPAAQQGHNTGTIAICLTGKRAFSEAQFDALYTLCQEIQLSYEYRLRFRGHCEVSAKACPVFDYRHVLGLDSGGYLR